jgi:3-methyladenine DNA glycosylase AlkD
MEPMDAAATLRALEALGTEPHRRMYRRHGAPDPVAGVSLPDLARLRARLGRSQPLAEALWASRHAEGRLLATMVADPARMTPARLRAWARDLDWHVLADLFVRHLVVRTPHARALAETWTAARDEWVARAGWMLLALLARDPALPDAPFATALARIERAIRRAPNRARDAMNTALIAIGLRGGSLERAALAAARRIGPVDVDHGASGGRTLDAVQYLRRARRLRQGPAPARAGRAAARAAPGTPVPRAAAARAARSRPAARAATRRSPAAPRAAGAAS